MKWYILCGIKTIKLVFGKCCSKIVFCKPNVGIAQRGCLKIELRWPLLFYFKLKSFGFFSKKEAYKLTFSIQGRFYKFNLSLANSQNLIKATANDKLNL